MPLLSLRLVISVVSALLVTVVAAAALTVLLTTSTASLRDVGRKHATGLIDTVQHRTVSLFEPSFVALDMFTNFSRTQFWDFPSNDRRVADKYYDRAESVYQMLELKSPGVLVYFWDNTRVSMNPYNSTHYQRYLIIGSPENATGGLGSQVLTSAGTLVDHTNNFKESFLSFNPNSEGNRLIGTSTEQLLLTITASGRQASIAGIFDRSDRSGAVESYVTMAAPLYRQGDAATRDNLYGMVLTSLFIADINNFLADSRSTPNTEAFAADIFGYLYGSSLVDRPTRTTTPIPDGDRTTIQGCTTTDSLGGVSDGPNQLVCRASYQTYGYAPLAALDRTVFRRPGKSVEITKLSGETFFVATVRVPMRLPGMPIQLVLLMPEADVIGDVVQSRNVAIGIVAALVVVAAVINFVVISVLLSPLEGVAARMRKAANLEDDAEEASVSAMAEVAALQEAYYEMNDELNRIRSFVPQSVLLAKKNAVDTDDEDIARDEDGAEDDVDMRSVSATSSKRTKGSPRDTSASLTSANLSSHSDIGPVSHDLEVRSERSVRSRLSGRGSTVRSFKSARSPVGGPSASASALSGLSLKPRVVTIVAANLCGFVASLGVKPDLELQHVTDTVDFVYQTVNRYGGVVASYHGDHFVATFNAVKVCGAHALGAARAATLLADGADGVGFGSALRVGVATGRCHVGNLGNKEVKAFSTVGPAYQHACVLERMGRLYGDADERSVLATRRTCADIATQFRFRFVDVVALPGRERGGTGATITPIATLLHPVIEGHGADGNDDEWLYVVADAGEGDANAAWNEAFNKLMSDDVAAAKALVTDYKATATSSMHVGSVAGSGAVQPMSSGDLLKKSNEDDGTGRGAPVPQVSLTSPSPAQPSLLSSGVDGAAPGTCSPNSSPMPSAGVAALTNSTALGPSWGSGAASARRPVYASEQELHQFDVLCGMDAVCRFRDMGEFYNAAFSI